MGNAAYILKPKQDVAYISEHITVRQALERMRRNGYTEVPVISRDGRYQGTVSEGDFLWFILDSGLEGEALGDLLRRTKVSALAQRRRNPPARITSPMEELLRQSVSQNFIPILDDRDMFIGIVVRGDIIKYFGDKVRPAGRQEALPAQAS